MDDRISNMNIAVNDALEENDFVEAERLCKLKVSDDSWRHAFDGDNRIETIVIRMEKN